MFGLSRPQWFLIIGDVVVLAAVTLTGFATHNTLTTAGARLFSTFLPLLLSWALLGVHVGVFDLESARAPRQLWRPFWTMILAAPLFGLLRAWMLGADAISALFLVILGGTSALVMLAWRSIFAFWLAPRLLR